MRQSVGTVFHLAWGRCGWRDDVVSGVELFKGYFRFEDWIQGIFFEFESHGYSACCVGYGCYSCSKAPVAKRDRQVPR